jgi:hypothetical protein
MSQISSIASSNVTTGFPLGLFVFMVQNDHNRLIKKHEEQLKEIAVKLGKS